MRFGILPLHRNSISDSFMHQTSGTQIRAYDFFCSNFHNPMESQLHLANLFALTDELVRRHRRRTLLYWRQINYMNGRSLGNSNHNNNANTTDSIG